MTDLSMLRLLYLTTLLWYRSWEKRETVKRHMDRRFESSHELFSWRKTNARASTANSEPAHLSKILDRTARSRVITWPLASSFCVPPSFRHFLLGPTKMPHPNISTHQNPFNSIVVAAIYSSTHQETMSPWRIAALLLSTIVGTAVAKIRSRTLANIYEPPTQVLACRVLLFDVMSLPSHDTATTTRDFWMCNPVRDGEIASQLYPIDLPPHIAASHRSFVATQSSSLSSARSLEDFYIGIPYGYIDEYEMNIGIPDPLNIYVMNVTHDHRRRRHLERRTVTSIGTYTALVVRITDNKGRDPFHSAQELTRTAFDPVGISAHSQYRNCSWGQFTIVPAGGDDLGILAQPGVLEVIVDLDVSTKDYRQVTQEAEKEALALLGVENLFDYTDFILYVTPPMGSWVAYASVGGGYSVYNSMWGGFLSSLVHEIG